MGETPDSPAPRRSPLATRGASDLAGAAAAAGAAFVGVEALVGTLRPEALAPAVATGEAAMAAFVLAGLLFSATLMLRIIFGQRAAVVSAALWAAAWGPHAARQGGLDAAWGALAPGVVLAAGVLSPGLALAVTALGGTAAPAMRWLAEGPIEAREATPLALDTPERAPRPNILLVTVDAVRTDAGLLGGPWAPDDPLSPTRGWLHFSEAVSSAPWTLPSFHSLFSGLPVREHGGGLLLDGSAGTAGERYSNRVAGAGSFVEVLRDRGWHTVALVSNPHLRPEAGFAEGFDVWLHADEAVEPLFLLHTWGRWSERMDAGPSRIRRDRDARLLTEALARIAGDSRTPQFVWVHLMGPHEYARVPEGAAIAGEAPEAAYARSAAEASVRVRTLAEAAGTGQIVAVTSDHGEAFPGGHGSALDDDQLRVPLALRGPGVDGGVVKGQVATSDLGRTLLCLAGDCGTFPGIDLRSQTRARLAGGVREGGQGPPLARVEVGGVRRHPDSFAARLEGGAFVAAEPGVVGPPAPTPAQAAREEIGALGYAGP